MNLNLIYLRTESCILLRKRGFFLLFKKIEINNIEVKSKPLKCRLFTSLDLFFGDLFILLVYDS